MNAFKSEAEKVRIVSKQRELLIGTIIVNVRRHQSDHKYFRYRCLVVRAHVKLPCECRSIIFRFALTVCSREKTRHSSFPAASIFLQWSHHIIPYHIISYHITSYHIILHHIISYHIILHHIMSYRIISYRIISCHIISCADLRDLLFKQIYFLDKLVAGLLYCVL